MNIIMVGAPGSGKGTLAAYMVEALGIKHVSSGDMIRECIKKEDAFAEKLNSYISKGLLVPDEIILEMIEKRLQEEDLIPGVILDGFPRNVEQAIALEKIFNKLNKKIDKAVYLNVPDEEIIQRIINRRTCSNKACKQIYNIKFSPSKQEGICDKCGSKLEQRADDTQEIVEERLRVYHEMSEELVEFYRKQGLLCEIQNKNDEKTQQQMLDIVIQNLKQ